MFYCINGFQYSRCLCFIHHCLFFILSTLVWLRCSLKISEAREAGSAHIEDIVMEQNIQWEHEEMSKIPFAVLRGHEGELKILCCLETSLAEFDLPVMI